MITVNHELIRSLTKCINKFGHMSEVGQTTRISKHLKPLIQLNGIKDITQLINKDVTFRTHYEFHKWLAKLLNLPKTEVDYHLLNMEDPQEFAEELQKSLNCDNILFKIRSILKALELADPPAIIKLVKALTAKYAYYVDSWTDFDARKEKLENQICDLFPGMPLYILWDALSNTIDDLVPSCVTTEYGTDCEELTNCVLVGLYEYLLLLEFGKLKHGHKPVFYNILKKYLQIE